jgi:membrane-associated protease RseP (regulator of RpoE activity)
MKRGRFSWAVALTAALGLGVLIPTTAPRALAADDEDQGTQKRVEIITDDPRDSNDSGDGYLGVQVQDLTRSLQRAMDLQGVEGALVNRVEEDSPADKAGIQKGDVVVRLGRADTPGADDLTTAVRSMKPGTRTTITVVRDGARKSLDLVVGSRPEGETPETPEMPQMPDLRGMGRVSPDQMHMYQDMIRQRQDMGHQMEELKAQISRLADEIRELRRELARRPIQER